jgi:soluble lytic murein transglycosylase
MRSSSPNAPRRARFTGARRLSAPSVVALALALAAACSAPSGRSGDPAERDPREDAKADPAYRDASIALSEHRPSRAAALLAPALADSTRRTAWVVLLAAEAAAASEQWELVDSLLAVPLADTRARASAHLLLARVRLEHGEAAPALEQARTAHLLAASPETEAHAKVFMARAHDRLGAKDSARAAYAEAATVLTPIGDWLTLRGTALTRDSAERRKSYDRLRTPTAKKHAAYAEAQLLERSGRARAAIALYEQAGTVMPAMRLRAATASGIAERERSRKELVAFIQANSGTPEARTAVEMLDDGRFKLMASEEVIVARSAAQHGPLSRARTGLQRAFAARPPTGEERLFQISVLVESGPASRSQAERLLAQIKKPSPYAGRASLERAKLIRRRGQTSAARTALRNVVRLFPDDTIAAPGALLILAEMATDEKRDASARDAYLTLARKYPTSEHAPRARFDAAILALANRNNKPAAAELDSIAELYPTSIDVPAARYWSARARLALRDTAGAEEQWQALLEIDSTSYYSSLAARRLGVDPWAPAASPDTFAVIPDVDETLARAGLLERLGMDYEARLEMDGLVASADSSGERVLAIGNAFRAREQMRRAMMLGRRAIALGSTDARAYRLVYPVGLADLVAAEAASRKLDPALAAAVIRQESSFEPRATSEAGARGLMQVMPRVAKALARAEKIVPWHESMLYDPDINIRLGVIHLKSFTGHYAHPAMALAAYNAGGSRVARWSGRPGGKDPELFVERIRFNETRGYVRTVLRSRDMYAALYGWGRPATAE